MTNGKRWLLATASALVLSTAHSHAQALDSGHGSTGPHERDANVRLLQCFTGEDERTLAWMTLKCVRKGAGVNRVLAIHSEAAANLRRMLDRSPGNGMVVTIGDWSGRETWNDVAQWDTENGRAIALTQAGLARGELTMQLTEGPLLEGETINLAFTTEGDDREDLRKWRTDCNGGYPITTRQPAKPTRAHTREWMPHDMDRRRMPEPNDLGVLIQATERRPTERSTPTPEPERTEVTNIQRYMWRAIRPCWSLVRVGGSGDDNGPTITVGVVLARDHRLADRPKRVRPQGVPTTYQQRLFRTAQEAIQRCEPYEALPLDRFDEWQHLELHFDSEGPIPTRK